MYNVHKVNVKASRFKFFYWLILTYVHSFMYVQHQQNTKKIQTCTGFNQARAKIYAFCFSYVNKPEKKILEKTVS